MSYDFENFRVSKSIMIKNAFRIEKMEDWYVFVTFRYDGAVWNGAIPLKSKYQAVNIPFEKADVIKWAEDCYEKLNPSNHVQWMKDQEAYWSKQKAEDTYLVFRALDGDEKTTKWLCRKCGPLPKVNPQSASRIRTIKEKGYHVATTKMDCLTCSTKQYFDILIRLPRFQADNQKRFTISETLRKRILELLSCTECVFDTPIEQKACIIDHKFPSSRWVNGEKLNHINMTNEEINSKFQILSQQTNLAKERYCQNCVINNVRGSLFGIKWYYEGDEVWRGTSKADENGCVGCPWYDVKRWKIEFNKYLVSKKSE